MGRPVPKENDVLTKIYATTCYIGDARVRRVDVPVWYTIPFRVHLGLTKQKRPVVGLEAAGESESVGRNVRRFTIGDEVFVCTGFVCWEHRSEHLMRSGRTLPEDRNRTSPSFTLPRDCEAIVERLS